MIKKKGEIIYEGVWFSSETSKKLIGVLIINQIDFTQTLKLYSKINFDNICLSRKELNFSDEQSICGDCEIDNKITLSKCIYKGKEHIGDGTFEITYKPTFCFSGGISFNIEDTNINLLTCTYPYLASWYDTDRLFFGTHSQSFDYLEDLTPAIKPTELFDEIKINDDFAIIIERRYRKENWVENEVKIDINHFVHFKSKNPMPFREFKKMAVILMQLIKLSTGKLMHINYVSMSINKNELIDYKRKYQNLEGGVNVYITNYNLLLKRKLFERDDINRNNLLFYGGKKQYERLHLVIRNWYATYDKYKPIYTIYLDTFEWFENTDAYLSQIMFNNRFLNLIQALENFHYLQNNNLSGEDKNEVETKAALLLKDFENKEDKDWLLHHIHPNHIQLRERLEYLILDKFKYITDGLFSGKKKKEGFVERIKYFRDKLSHGDKIELTPDKISDYYYKTLLILLSCILSNLGFSDKEIAKAYVSTLKYNSMLSYIKEYWNKR